MNDHNEPPSTIKEVGIHIGYMRDDIAELKELFKNMPTAFATKAELDTLRSEFDEKLDSVETTVKALDIRLGTQENRWNGLNAKIAGYAVTGLVLMLLALYGLDKFFKP
ncbi:hypothetical protein [Rhodococcus qingshengii]|uniref:hypothetical protein n=1 Tax=Rhodococcus qingshengii TaxID=334542 RepID=UPI002942976E|nr:hypothetical protein [Rhodococcus qingshengii]WOI86003.1 hypothetical protein R0122_22755 [Rhodococcus qingshengii]